MIFGIFKDKETIQLAKDLTLSVLEAKRLLNKLPKNKLNENNIVSALEPMVNYPFIHSVTVDKLAIHINIKARDLHLTIFPKYTEKENGYKNYELTLMGIYDYRGFSISYKPEDDKPTVLLLDTSKFVDTSKLVSGAGLIKPTKKAKLLHEEISKFKKFFNTNKIG